MKYTYIKPEKVASKTKTKRNVRDKNNPFQYLTPKHEFLFTLYFLLKMALLRVWTEDTRNKKVRIINKNHK